MKQFLFAIAATLITIYVSYMVGYDKAVAVITNQVNAERIEWQEKVSKLESKFNEYRLNVETKHRFEVEDYKKQVQVLKDNPTVITKYITKEVQVPCQFNLLHDRLVDGVPINTMIPDDYQCKPCTLSDVSTVLAQNYANCRLAMQRLEALQSVVKEFQAKQTNLKDKE